MKQRLVSFSIAIMSTWLWCGAASAQRVAVCRGPYTQTLEAERTSERAEFVAQRLAKTRPFSPELSLEPMSCACADAACLQAIRDLHRTDGAIAVTVEEDAGQYRAVLFDDRGEAEMASATGSFQDLLDAIDILASRFLIKHFAKAAPPIAETEETPFPKALPKDPGPAGKRPLRPVAFGVSLGITAALGLTAGMLDLGASTKRKELEGVPKSQRRMSDWKTGKNLQTAERVFLIATATGVVTSGLLALFTNFGAKKKETTSRPKVVLLPSGVMLPGGCALVLKGEY